MFTLHETKPPPLDKILLIHSLNLLVDDDSTLENGSLVIEKNKIAAVGPTDQLISAYSDATTVDGTGYTALPGLINSHTHSSMAFFRGLGHGPLKRSDGRSTMIEELFYPAEKNLSEELIEPLAYSYLIDALKSGTTTVVDSYVYSGSVAKALERLGLRGVVGEHIADLGGHLPAGFDLWKRVKGRIEGWPSSSLVSPMVYAHATDTVSGPLLRELGSFAKSNNLPFQMHLSQSQGERERVISRENLSPVAFASSCGVLGPRTMAVHLLSIDDDDASLLENSGTHAVICAVSEIIYEKAPPLDLLAKKNIPWILGTDCAASNDGADLLTEMRFFRLLAKGQGVPLSCISPYKVLKAATLTPARVLGLNTGVLSKNMAADIIFLKDDITTKPCPDLGTNVLHTYTTRHVHHSLIDGKWALWQRGLVQFSEAAAEEAYFNAVEIIKKRANL